MYSWADLIHPWDLFRWKRLLFTSPSLPHLQSCFRVTFCISWTSVYLLLDFDLCGPQSLFYRSRRKPSPCQGGAAGRKRMSLFNVARGRKGATEDLFKWDIQPNLICMAEEREGDMRGRKRRDRRIEYGLEGWIFYYFAPFCWSPCCSSVLELKYIDVAERSVSVAHVVQGRCVGVPLEPWIMGTARYSSTSLRPEANLLPVFWVLGSGLE